MIERRAALSALATSLVACGTHPAETTAARASPIIAGVESPSPADDAVVLIRHTATGTETVCSATLVAPNLIVTSRHCVAYGTEGGYYCTPSGQLVEGPDGGGHIGVDVPAEAIEIHSGGAQPSAAPVALGKQIISTLSLTSCLDDLAFVSLDRDVDGPVAALRMGKQTRVGDTVTLVGYGAQANGNFDWHTQPRQKVINQIIAAVGPDSAQGIVPMVIPRTFNVHGPSVCEGDSGGPALSEKTGAVVGVYSSSTPSDCTSANRENSYANMSSFAKLALQAFAAAGAKPMREPPGLSMGEACQTTGDCERGDCLAGSDGIARCTVVCGAVSPCPAGFSCETGADAGVRVCMPDAPTICHCGSPSCPPCEAGVVSPAPESNGGCSVAHGERRSHVASAFFITLMAVVARLFLRATGKRA
jgi:hypothetical protein